MPDNPEKMRETANALGLLLIAFRADPRVERNIADAKRQLFEAADRIAELEAERDRLREALGDIAEGRGMFGVNTGTDLIWATEHARAALKGGDT